MDALSIGLLVLGFIGGITVSFTIVYLVYCYNEAQRKKKEREKHEKQEEEANADEKKEESREREMSHERYGLNVLCIFIVSLYSTELIN